MTSRQVALFSLICAGIGLLLIFEVIRPFREMAKDGPLAMISWGVGTAAAVVSLYVRPRSRVLGVVALLINVIPAGVVAAVLTLLSRSTLIWH